METTPTNEPTSESSRFDFYLPESKAKKQVAQSTNVDFRAISLAVAQEMLTFRDTFNILAKSSTIVSDPDCVINCEFVPCHHPISVSEYLYENRLVLGINRPDSRRITIELGIPDIVALRNYLDSMVQTLEPVTEEATKVLREEELRRVATCN